MEMFEIMNKKLDEGWKLSDGKCPECSSIIMFVPKDSTFFCLKCKKTVDVESEKSEGDRRQTERVEVTPAPAPVPKVERPSSDQISKKMSEKLLQGWAMLEKICDDCNVPLMRSKRGDEICYGCNRNYKPQAAPVPTPAPALPPPKYTPPSPQSFQKHQPPKMPEHKTLHTQSKSAIENKPSILHSSIGPVTGETVERSLSQALLKTLAFYTNRIDSAIARGDEVEVTRLLGSLQKVADINSKISKQ